MVNSPLIRPYFLGGVALGGGPLDPHERIIKHNDWKLKPTTFSQIIQRNEHGNVFSWVSISCNSEWGEVSGLTHTHTRPLSIKRITEVIKNEHIMSKFLCSKKSFCIPEIPYVGFITNLPVATTTKAAVFRHFDCCQFPPKWIATQLTQPAHLHSLTSSLLLHKPGRDNTWIFQICKNNCLLVGFFGWKGLNWHKLHTWKIQVCEILRYFSRWLENPPKPFSTIYSSRFVEWIFQPATFTGVHDLFYTKMNTSQLLMKIKSITCLANGFKP